MGHAHAKHLPAEAPCSLPANPTEKERSDFHACVMHPKTPGFPYKPFDTMKHNILEMKSDEQGRAAALACSTFNEDYLKKLKKSHAFPYHVDNLPRTKEICKDRVFEKPDHCAFKFDSAVPKYGMCSPEKGFQTNVWKMDQNRAGIMPKLYEDECKEHAESMAEFCGVHGKVSSKLVDKKEAAEINKKNKEAITSYEKTVHKEREYWKKKAEERKRLEKEGEEGKAVYCAIKMNEINNKKLCTPLHGIKDDQWLAGHSAETASSCKKVANFTKVLCDAASVEQKLVTKEENEKMNKAMTETMKDARKEENEERAKKRMQPHVDKKKEAYNTAKLRLDQYSSALNKAFDAA